jgi:hypothetical protein
MTGRFPALRFQVTKGRLGQLEARVTLIDLRLSFRVCLSMDIHVFLAYYVRKWY